MESATTDHLASLLLDIQTFLREEIYPLEADLRRRGFRALLPRLAQKRNEVKTQEWWCPQVPTSFGGLGLSLVEFAQVSEILGQSPLGHYVFNCQAPDAGNMEILMEYGTPDQQDRYLVPLLEGNIRSCFAMTEPEHAGSNPVWMSTTAVKDGTDYIIHGHKWFTSAADGAAFAIAMVITQPDAENPYKRASQIIVPTEAPGYQHVRRIPLMGDIGEDYASHSEIRFDQCRVPQTNLLGPEHDGFVIAQQRLGPGRIHHCMRWIGICERAFSMLCERAASRELAPGKPLGTRQIIQHWIAESRAEINAARLLILDAAQTIDQQGSRAARKKISLIKFYTAGVLGRVLDHAIQTHGALGLTDDLLLSYWYRHERGARIYDGPDEVHKSLVARAELKPFGLKLKE